MSRKKHIYPNGTKVQVYFEGSPVGTATIVDHDIETDEDPKVQDEERKFFWTLVGLSVLSFMFLAAVTILTGDPKK